MYFEKPGRDNTDSTLEQAHIRAQELGSNEVVVASSKGTKVAVEIAIMAADGGALSGKDIVSIGDTGKGADAALILKPANQSHLFDLRVREVICTPRNF